MAAAVSAPIESLSKVVFFIGLYRSDPQRLDISPLRANIGKVKAAYCRRRPRLAGES
jgi:hypothetical protein